MGPSNREIDGISSSREGEVPGFRWYVEVCEAYEEAANATEDDDMENAKEVFAQYGINQVDVCGFAVFGFPVQDWLTFEASEAELAGHVEDLRTLVRKYERQLQERYEITKAGADRLKQQFEE